MHARSFCSGDVEMSALPEVAWRRRCAIATLGCWLGFAVFIALAMELYPGGNWRDPSAPGSRFCYNFFCDLTQPVSISGVANSAGAACARIGMWSFALALGGFFWLLPLHFVAPASTRARVWVRALGVCAAFGASLVPLLPSQRFGRLHGVLALVAGGLGILAALLAVVFSRHAPGRARWFAGLGTLTLAAGGFHAALFAYHLNDGLPPPLLLPAVQKVAALLLSAWIIGVAYDALRPEPPSIIRRP